MLLGWKNTSLTRPWQYNSRGRSDKSDKSDKLDGYKQKAAKTL